jgi:hypothetical protein
MSEIPFAYLYSNCHPDEPTWAVIHADQRLTIECSKCKAEVMSFRVHPSDFQRLAGHSNSPTTQQ